MLIRLMIRLMEHTNKGGESLILKKFCILDGFYSLGDRLVSYIPYPAAFLRFAKEI